MCNVKFLKVVLLVLAFCQITSCSASKKSAPKYGMESEVKEKIDEYTLGGWKIHGSSRTIKGKLIEHYTKLNENPDIIEVIGTSTGCRSVTVCRASAINAASTELAIKMGQDIIGQAVRELGINEGGEIPAEFNKFNQACTSKFQGAIKEDLQESFAMIRTSADGLNNYEIYFLLNKDSAKKKRIQAIMEAIEVAKLDAKYVEVLRKRINDEFNIQ